MLGFSASNGWFAEDSGSQFVFTIKPNRHSCCAEKIVGKIRPLGYKTFFMLNSAEHEI